MKPGKSGIARIIDATRYSLRGLRFCWQHEAAFRQEVLLILVLFPLSFFVAQRVEQWLLLVIPLVVLLIVELLNSAIEYAVDRIGPELHELSGRAKDTASAAVFLCNLTIGLSWVVIFWNNFVS